MGDLRIISWDSQQFKCIPVVSQYQGKRKEYQRIKLVSQLLHSNLDRYVQYVSNSSFLDSKSIKMIFSGDSGL